MRIIIFIISVLFTIYFSACFDDNIKELILDENSIFDTHYVYFPLSDEEPADINYTDNNDGTVKDTKTGLLWTKCTLADQGAIATNDTCDNYDLSPVQYSWWDARELCEALELADRKWRLPTFPELFSLVSLQASVPAYEDGFLIAINSNIFPDTQYNTEGRGEHDDVRNETGHTLYLEDILYWTSTLQKNNNTHNTHAYYIDFFNGFSNNRSIELNPLFQIYEKNYVRCIAVDPLE